MRLFEDIIDSVEAAQDVQTASSVVSAEDEPLFITIDGLPDDEPVNELFSEFSHCFIISRSPVEKDDFERQISVFRSLVETSTVIDNVSVAYNCIVNKFVNQFMIWVNFTEDFNWTSYLTLLTRINNMFWDIKRNLNEFKIFDKKHNEKMIIHMNVFKTSFFVHMNTIKNDIIKYLKTHDDFKQCNLYPMTIYSGVIISIFDSVYGDLYQKGTNYKKGIVELLYAIADFDTNEIYSYNPELKRERY